MSQLVLNSQWFCLKWRTGEVAGGKWTRNRRNSGQAISMSETQSLSISHGWRKAHSLPTEVGLWRFNGHSKIGTALLNAYPLTILNITR